MTISSRLFRTETAPAAHRRAVRLFRCGDCGHRMRLSGPRCGACFSRKRVTQRPAAWVVLGLAVALAGAAIAFT